MKNEILKWTLVGALITAGSPSVGQDIDRNVVTNADSVVTAPDMHQIRIDSAVEYRHFKAAAELKISENQKNINLLRNQKSVTSQQAEDLYDRELMRLQEKNSVLKSRISVSGQTETAEWSTYKTALNQDILELSRAIKIIAAKRDL